MTSARRLFVSAALAASVLAPELSAQDPFWIQPFQAPASEFPELLTRLQFSTIFGTGIRFDLFMLAPEFFQGPAALTTPSIWSQTLGSLQGELVSLPIGLTFAPGTFLGLGLTLPADLTGVSLHSHDLCLNPICEVDPGTLPFVTLRSRNPQSGLYTSFGSQQMVGFSASWEDATTTTPEPSTLALVASGLLTVVAFRRLKRRRVAHLLDA